MIIYDYEDRKQYEQGTFPAVCGAHTPVFVFCRANDVPQLQDIWSFDESTVLDCVHIDESIRFTAFDGYDFVSLVHMENAGHAMLYSEINLYVSRRYLVLAMPPHQSAQLAALEAQLHAVAQNVMGAPIADPLECLNHLFFQFFNLLLSAYAELLEQMEDDMEELFVQITRQTKETDELFVQIQGARQLAYAVKKVLRALSYMGLQILCNENEILAKRKMFLFRNLDTRFRKLCDFAENVHGLSAELLTAYDSKLAQHTNDVVNKLTVVTLFFGPLTVITGIYGMNFELMPELDWPFGYPLVLLVMLGISFLLYKLMRKKHWL